MMRLLFVFVFRLKLSLCLFTCLALFGVAVIPPSLHQSSTSSRVNAYHHQPDVKPKIVEVPSEVSQIPTRTDIALQSPSEIAQSRQHKTSVLRSSRGQEVEQQSHQRRFLHESLNLSLDSKIANITFIPRILRKHRSRSLTLSSQLQTLVDVVTPEALLFYHRIHEKERPFISRTYLRDETISSGGPEFIRNIASLNREDAEAFRKLSQESRIGFLRLAEGGGIKLPFYLVLECIIGTPAQQQLADLLSEAIEGNSLSSLPAFLSLDPEIEVAGANGRLLYYYIEERQKRKVKLTPPRGNNKKAHDQYFMAVKSALMLTDRDIALAAAYGFIRTISFYLSVVAVSDDLLRLAIRTHTSVFRYGVHYYLIRSSGSGGSFPLISSLLSLGRYKMVDVLWKHLSLQQKVPAFYMGTSSYYRDKWGGDASILFLEVFSSSGVSDQPEKAKAFIHQVPSHMQDNLEKSFVRFIDFAFETAEYIGSLEKRYKSWLRSPECRELEVKSPHPLIEKLIHTLKSRLLSGERQSVQLIGHSEEILRRGAVFFGQLYSIDKVPLPPSEIKDAVYHFRTSEDCPRKAEISHLGLGTMDRDTHTTFMDIIPRQRVSLHHYGLLVKTHGYKPRKLYSGPSLIGNLLTLSETNILSHFIYSNLDSDPLIRNLHTNLFLDPEGVVGIQEELQTVPGISFCVFHDFFNKPKMIQIITRWFDSAQRSPGSQGVITIRDHLIRRLDSLLGESPAPYASKLYSKLLRLLGSEIDIQRRENL